MWDDDVLLLLFEVLKTSGQTVLLKQNDLLDDESDNFSLY